MTAHTDYDVLDEFGIDYGDDGTAALIHTACGNEIEDPHGLSLGWLAMRAIAHLDECEEDGDE